MTFFILFTFILLGPTLVYSVIYWNGTLLTTNHEIDIKGTRIRETLLHEKKYMATLKTTLGGIYERLNQCAYSMDRMNDTANEQHAIIRMLKDRIDKFSFVCYGRNQLQNPCGGHGDCVADDHCECDDEWMEKDCNVMRLAWKEVAIANEQVTKPRERNVASGVVYQDAMWILGGRQETNEVLDDVWTFSFVNHTYINVSTFSYGVAHHSAVVYDDAMWIFGGWDGSEVGGYRNDLWKFRFSDLSWEEMDVAEKPSPRRSHSAVVYNESMWIFGGQDDSVGMNDVWKYEFNGLWEQMNDTIGEREQHSAVVYNDTMWVFGGRTSSLPSSTLDEFIYFDFLSLMWDEIALMPEILPYCGGLQ